MHKKLMRYLILLLVFIVFMSFFTIGVLAKPPTIEISKTADKDSVDFGENLTYTINVTNIGSSAIGAFTVEDLLPQETIFQSAPPTYRSVDIVDGKIRRVFWDFSGLNAGQSILINLTVKNNVSEGTLVNQAWVRTSSGEIGPVTVHTNVQTIAIPEFPSIAVPMILSVFSFGIVSFIKFKKK